MRLSAALLLLICLLLSSARADQLQEGIAAYHSSEENIRRTAIKILQLLAERGNPEADYQIGEMYRLGWGVQADETEAAKWYKAAAGIWERLAGQGNAEAQHRLGYLYAVGRGVPEDTAEAAKWFRKSAEHGDADEECYLGWAFYVGNGSGLVQDYAEAAKWFLLAAKQGNEEALFYLDQMYQLGRGVKQDQAENYFWFFLQAKINKRRFLSLSFDKGEAPESIEEQKTFSFVTETYKPWEAPPPKHPGPEYKAAMADVEAAKKRVETWTSDFSPTLKLAEQGDARAQAEIGEIYEWGIGVKQDYAEALKWFRKAAETGNTKALFSLSQMYAHGLGVKQDYAEAYFWHVIGDDSNRSSGYAITSLEFSSQHLTEEQKAVTKKRAVAWCRTHGFSPPLPGSPLSEPAKP